MTIKSHTGMIIGFARILVAFKNQIINTWNRAWRKRHKEGGL